MKKICLLAVLSLSMYSCLLLNQRRARDVYVEAGKQEELESAVLVLDSVTVERGLDSGDLETSARRIFEVILGREAQTAKQPQTELLLRAFIREEEFTEEFKTLNTVAVELCVFEKDGQTPVAVALYSESSSKTIESYPYLYTVLRRALRHLKD